MLMNHIKITYRLRYTHELAIRHNFPELKKYGTEKHMYSSLARGSQLTQF